MPAPNRTTQSPVDAHSEPGGSPAARRAVAAKVALALIVVLLVPSILLTLSRTASQRDSTWQSGPCVRQPTATTGGITDEALTVGVQFKGMWADYTDDERARVLDLLAAAGVKSVRIDVSWAMLQPDGPDSYSEWGADFVDEVITMATDRGLAPLVTLWLSPAWANGGQPERALPTDPADFGRVAQWAAARWRGQVAAWEVWNEPNDTTYMHGADPAAYARLLQAAYCGFKAGAPETPVVFGGTSYVDTGWVARAYAAGAAGWFDAMGTHPYQGRADAPPETADDGSRLWLRHLAALHALMSANGDGDKPIWITEVGWSSHSNAPDTPSWELGVSATVQAEYLVRMLRLLESEYPYVRCVYWYTERDQATGDVHQDGYGLLTRDLQPKPAYHALAAELGY